MIITYLKLRGYRRLGVNNFNELTYEPGMNVQIILGSNGSGKSSTLKELTPLPAHLTKDYNDDGYKEIRIEHKDSKYILISDATINKHKFIVDGKEHNDGGTRRAQLQLVKDHFNITPLIHDVMSGTVTFTKMSVSERKKWLTDIADVDYTYSIGVYNRLKTRHRDIVGGIKLLNFKLATLEKSTISDEEIVSLKNDHNVLISMIDMLLESKSDIPITTPYSTDDMNKNITKLEKALRLAPHEVTVDNVKDSLSQRTVILDSLNKKSDEILNKLDLISKNETLGDPDNIMKLKDDIKNVNKEISNITSKSTLGFEYTEISRAHNSLSIIYDDVLDIYDELISYSDTDTSTETIRKITGRRDSLISIIQTHRSKLNRLEGYKDTLEENKKKHAITCVNCGHSWLDGYTDEKYKQVIDNISNVSKEISKYSKELDEVSDKLKIIETKTGLLTKLDQLFRYDNLTSRILDIINYKLKDEINATHVTLLFKIRKELEDSLVLPNLYDKLTELISIKDSSDRVNEAVKKVQLDNRSVLEVTLNKIYSDIDKVTTEVNHYTKLLELVKDRDVLKDDLVKKLDKTKEYADYEVIRIRNEYIVDAIKILRLESSNIESKLNDNSMNKHMFDSTKKELGDMQNTKIVMDLMLKELSPNEGLIAKSILSFLKGFTDNMNVIINNLWSYELLVLPCGVDNGNDLDYRFPINIVGNNNISDISLASTSMQEIINLAFKIISAVKLGIGDHPLILDEYSSSFDSVHRLKAYDNIDRLSKEFTQVFIVSHYMEIYGRFTNADVSIISPDNLFLDDIKDYNKRMTFN